MSLGTRENEGTRERVRRRPTNIGVLFGGFGEKNGWRFQVYLVSSSTRAWERGKTSRGLGAGDNWKRWRGSQEATHKHISIS